MEDSPSGLWRTLGKRVGVTASRVRISYPPPGFEPRKPLKSFGFRGFALIPPDCRFPPGSLRFDTFGPDLPRVSHIGTDDSENAFEPPPAARPPSKPDPAPRVPPAGRSEPPHAPRAVFPFWFATIPDARRAARCAPCGPAQREGSPGPPPTNATRTHTGAITAHSNRQSTPSYIDRKPRNVRRSDGFEEKPADPTAGIPPPGIRQRTAPAPP